MGEMAKAFVRRHMSKFLGAWVVVIIGTVLVEGIFNVGSRLYPAIEGIVMLAIMLPLARWVNGSWKPPEPESPRDTSKRRGRGKRPALRRRSEGNGR